MDFLTNFCMILRSFYRIFFILINNFGCVITFVTLCCLLCPFYFWNSDLYWELEGQLYLCVLSMVAYWSYSAGYYIVETGDRIESIVNENTLIMINHQSTSDVPLLMQAFCVKKGLIENLVWIIAAMFKNTHFGFCSRIHGDFFIDEGLDRREATLKELENFLKTTFLQRNRKWIVLFPEGGFLCNRKEGSKRYAARMNLPNLEHVALPRLGAVQLIIDTLVPLPKTNSMSTAVGCGNNLPASRQLKYIVDTTIAYPNGEEPLNIIDIFTGRAASCKVRMHYKIYPIEEVPHHNPDELQKWLYNIYIEKNNMLGHYYKTCVWDPNAAKVDINQESSDQAPSSESSGDEIEFISSSIGRFPSPAKGLWPRPVRMDLFTIIFINFVCFALSVYFFMFFYKMFTAATEFFFK